MDSSTIKSHSPNFDDRPQDAKISIIVIHHTELNNIKEVYKIFENPESKVSSQYLIGRDGSLHQFVEDHQRAWHAGVSEWGGKEGLNDYSIGIELDNNGMEKFAEPLMLTLVSLCKHLIDNYNIKNVNIVAHSDIAYWRKVDPSIRFDWQWLAQQGIGYFPKFECQPSELDLDKSVIPRLCRLGYKKPLNDHEISELLKAFKRRYTPKSYNLGMWDTLADGRLNELIKKYEL